MQMAAYPGIKTLSVRWHTFILAWHTLYAVFASALNCGRNVPILYVKVPGAIFRYQSGFLAEHFNAIRATYFHI
jgi:hypothetical protein